KRGVLEQHCRAAKRDPATIRRSLMVPYIIGRDARERDARLAGVRRIFPRVPDSEAAWHPAAFLFADPARLVDALPPCDKVRVMLQTLDMEAVAAIELLAREVVPACR